MGRYGLVDSDEESDADMQDSDLPHGMRKRRSPRSPLDRRAGRSGLMEDEGGTDDAGGDGDFPFFLCHRMHGGMDMTALPRLPIN